MRVLDKSEFEVYKKVHLGMLNKGSLFIYPTDTIYGIGCDATNGEAIEKIRDLKERPEQPFSVIAPSVDWIIENCEVPEHANPWLEKLPGPYTFVFKLKNKDSVHPNVNKDKETIGVRIPDHWISDAVKEFGKPVVTTSPNKHGSDVPSHPDELDLDFHPHVGFMVYEGRLHNPPSSVIKLTDAKHEFLRGRN